MEGEDRVHKDFKKLKGDWQKIGRERPYWGVLTNELFLPESIDGNIDKFYERGRKAVERLREIARENDFAFEGKRVLDFGCGVGRLSLAMARYAKDVVGVDISEGMLKEARKHCNHGNVEFMLSDNLEEFGTASFDAIISLITLQHIRPLLMKEYIGRLLRLLKPGCYAFLDTRTEVAIATVTAETSRYMEVHFRPGDYVEEIGTANDCVIRAAVPRGRKDGNMGFIFVFCKNTT